MATPMATTKVVDALLEEAALKTYQDYGYLTMGTGTAFFTNTSTDLTSGTAISASSYAKIQDNSSIGSFISGRAFVKVWDLGADEPVNQPINLGEMGMKKTSGTTADLGVGARLNNVQTKDSLIKHRVRMSFRVNRQGE